MPAPLHARPRTYRPLPDQMHSVADWHEPQPRITFVEDVESTIDEDLREFDRMWRLGMICGVIVAGLIWWAQS